MLSEKHWDPDLIPIEMLEDGTAIRRRLDLCEQTVVHLAAANGKPRILTKLLDVPGADVNCGQESSRLTPLSFACGARSYEERDMKKDEEGYLPGSLECATILLDRGADPNAMYHGSCIGAQYYGFPLRFACYAGDRNIEVIRLLLSRGAKIPANLPDGGRHTGNGYEVFTDPQGSAHPLTILKNTKNSELALKALEEEFAKGR